jgi:hypothetical protein
MLFLPDEFGRESLLTILKYVSARREAVRQETNEPLLITYHFVVDACELLESFLDAGHLLNHMSALNLSCVGRWELAKSRVLKTPQGWARQESKEKEVPTAPSI